MNETLYFFVSLLLGSIPFAWLLGRCRGVDLLETGSRNPGATNLARTLGVRWGVVAFLFDSGKGFLAVQVGGALVSGAPIWLLLVGGCLAVIGHCFSPFLGGRGGKGVATAAGVIAALEPGLFLGLALVWLLSVALLRNVGISSSAVAVIAAGYAAYRWLDPDHPPGTGIMSACIFSLAVLVIVRHRKNIASFVRSAEPEAKP